MNPQIMKEGNKHHESLFLQEKSNNTQNIGFCLCDSTSKRWRTGKSTPSSFVLIRVMVSVHFRLIVRLSFFPFIQTKYCGWNVYFPPFIKNRFFPHVIYHDYSFPSFHSSQFLSLLLLSSESTLCLSLKENRFLRDNNKIEQNEMKWCKAKPITVSLEKTNQQKEKNLKEGKRQRPTHCTHFTKLKAETYMQKTWCRTMQSPYMLL